jgi:DNA-binding CsgD family transcriptional regulator
VLQLIAEGLSTKEIAQRLRLSAKTVETHRTELMKRLGIRGIPGLVRYAMRVGIISRT